MEAYSTADEIIGELVKFYDLDSKISYLINVQGVLMEKGYILDQIHRNRFEEDEYEEKDEFHWKLFYNFSGYRAFLSLKNMALYEHSLGTFLIMFNHLVEQFRRGVLSLKSL